MYNYGATQRLAVTDTVAAVTNSTGYSVQYRVLSNRVVMLRFDGQNAEQENSLPLAADTPEFIVLQPGTAISFVLRDGESDGHIWLTRVS